MFSWLILFYNTLLQTKTTPLGLAFSPNGRLFATLARDRKVGDTFSPNRWLFATLARDRKVGDTFSPNGRLFATLARDRKVGDTFSPNWRLFATLARDRKVGDTFSPNGRFFATLARDRKVGDTFSPNGRLFARDKKVGEAFYSIVSCGTEMIHHARNIRPKIFLTKRHFLYPYLFLNIKNLMSFNELACTVCMIVVVRMQYLVL